MTGGIAMFDQNRRKAAQNIEWGILSLEVSQILDTPNPNKRQKECLQESLKWVRKALDGLKIIHDAIDQKANLETTIITALAVQVLKTIRDSQPTLLQTPETSTQTLSKILSVLQYKNAELQQRPNDMAVKLTKAFFQNLTAILRADLMATEETTYD